MLNFNCGKCFLLIYYLHKKKNNQKYFTSHKVFKPKYGYQNKHFIYNQYAYGKKSVHKHKKISDVKDNEQCHSNNSRSSLVL